MNQSNKERIETMARMYAAMIEPVPGEEYDDTCRRLKTAVGGRIEKPVFRKALNIIRRENGKTN